MQEFGFAVLFDKKDMLMMVCRYALGSLISLAQTNKALRDFLNSARAEPLWQLRFLAETFGHNDLDLRISAKTNYFSYLSWAYDDPDAQDMAIELTVAMRRKRHAYAMACYHGDCASLARMLDDSPDDLNLGFPNISGDDPDSLIATLLTMALASGQFGVAQYLIEEKQITLDGALYAAARSGVIEQVQYLLNRGANIHDESAAHGTALHAAARKNDVRMIDFLLAKGSDVNHKNDMLEQPLHTAAWCGAYQAVQRLIQAGASLFEFEDQGYTPFHCAIWSRQYDVVKLMVEQYAVSVTQPNQHGRSALEMLSSMAKERMDEAMLDCMCYLAGAQYTPVPRPPALREPFLFLAGKRKPYDQDDENDEHMGNLFAVKRTRG